MQSRPSGYGSFAVAPFAPCPRTADWPTGTLTVAPRNFLDHNGVAMPAVDAPHRVQQEHEKPPEGNELKALFPELVVTGRGPMAARTDGGGALAWPHCDLDALAVGTEASPMIDKSPEVMTAV